MAEIIDIPKGLLVFLEGLCTPKCWKSWKTRFNGKIHDFLEIFTNFHENAEIMWNSAFSSPGSLKNTKKTLRNINDFTHGGAGASILRKGREIHEI